MPSSEPKAQTDAQGAKSATPGKQIVPVPNAAQSRTSPILIAQLQSTTESTIANGTSINGDIWETAQQEIHKNEECASILVDFRGDGKVSVDNILQLFVTAGDV